MDYQSRIVMIQRKFIVNMKTLYIKHKALDTDESIGLYFDEIANGINARMPTDINEDEFISVLRKIWERCIQGHKSNFYFSLSLVIKAASDVSRDFNERRKAANRKFESAEKGAGQAEAVKNCKTHPEEFGWTIEKCHKWLDDIDGMIARQEINVHVARSLQGIPRAALKRLGYVEPVVELPEFDAL